LAGFDSSSSNLYAKQSVRIQGTTKLYGIVGWPVTHSLSPMFQSLFLQQRGLDAAYLPFGVTPEFLQQAMDGLWALGVEGFNVTVPHKEAVFNRVTCDDNARLIGAVNTVRRATDGWQATNTDWLGFQAVIDGLGVQLQKRKALLFGAGGTARAILHALSFKNLETLYICNRNPERLQAFIGFAEQNYPSMNCQTVAWQQEKVTQACVDAALLVNATSIGLNKADSFPFSLAGSGVCVDAVYSPSGKTAFTRASTGLCVDGLPMLIAQGAESFAWWHDGKKPDRVAALCWMESHLGRRNTALPGWEGMV